MSRDLASALLPALLPLANSFAENKVEAEIKELVLALFAANLAETAFDVNVLGAAHLGSFDLVRKSVNWDGLIIMQGEGEESATRYLYRAWKAADVQGRGLHFLRTYLQMVWPTGWTLSQLWHPVATAGAYPANAHVTAVPASDFLTSRLRLEVPVDVDNGTGLARMQNVLRAVIPARFILELRTNTHLSANLTVVAGAAASSPIYIAGAMVQPDIPVSDAPVSVDSGVSASSPIYIGGGFV